MERPPVKIAKAGRAYGAVETIQPAHRARSAQSRVAAEYAGRSIPCHPRGHPMCATHARLQERVIIVRRARASMPLLRSSAALSGAAANFWKRAMLQRQVDRLFERRLRPHRRQVMEKLGIAANSSRTARKIHQTDGRLRGTGEGRSRVGIQQINVLLPVAGADYVGPLPERAAGLRAVLDPAYSQYRKPGRTRQCFPENSPLRRKAPPLLR